ncbi:DNA polymerase I [Apilactobacillus sp. M161]|uniref:DNA polymerase I n=1 Tax=Apilactobacillus xinyiensis TaxID=2841032 RepID=A0ABT0I184_9LACO|nr:DNA polymerase I [Apilactobacillus xinyiensis]MCK8624234.1 DNA polymerase I [Apilactobacillus xinyiensis]
MANKKLLLIDGNSILYKAFYALYRSIDRFTNSDGLHTNAIYGFNNMLQTMLDKVQPDMALAAFDFGKITFRTELYSDYKGGRNKTPDELIEQFDGVKELLSARGIKSYELKNYEADDIIGTLSKQAENKGYETTIVTGDRDLTQLCSDLVTVSISKTGTSNIVHYDAKYVKKNMNITPSQIIDVKALQGDNSDNYPGVEKVGPKTALKLINQYGNIENLYDNIDDISGKKLKEHLIDGKHNAILGKQLATIKRDAPLEISVNDIPYLGDQIDSLIAFYKKMNFRKFLSSMSSKDEIKLLPVDYVTLNADNLIDLEKINFNECSFYLEMDGDNYHNAPIVGFVIGSGNQLFASRDTTILKSDLISNILESDKILKNVFDAKRTYVGLNRLGIKLNHVNFDMLIASYLLDTNDNSNDLGKIANLHDYYDINSDEDVYGKGAKRSIPEDDNVFLSHLVRKAKAIDELKNPLFEKLQQHNQKTLYQKIELPVTFVLADMEINGITVNSEYLSNMGSKLKERISEIEQSIYNMANEKFNIGSPKQLGVVLFEKMGLPVIKKTKTGYSTAVDVLEQLASEYPIVQEILNYRQLSKILSTYVDGILKVVNSDDNKVHTRYLQTLTQTGRLSSVDPNLQNIPVRTNEGRLIRKAFVPHKEGWKIFSSDYSQIELRVLASITGDKNMQEEFMNNDDIHASTARRIFGLSSNDEVTPNIRRQAKAVNFGIVYGISDFGLAKNTGISRAQAKSFIDKYFDEYPGVKKYMDNSVEDAKEKGYVETIAHRRRYIPEINSKNFHQRSFAERTAINSPIQGSAADIIKIAMINMAKATKNMQAQMLLQVHDELIFEAPVEEISKLEKLVPSIMDSAVELNVPLKVKSHYGNNWYDLK